MKKIISTLCTVIILLCVSFAFVGCTDNKETVGKIGDTVTNSDGVAFTLVSCENTKQVGSGLLSDTTENNYILLTIKVTNNSNKSQTIYSGGSDLYNSKGQKYNSKTSLYIDYILSEDIGTGISKTFQVLFETPTTTTQEKYTLKVGYSMYTSDRDRVVFDLSQSNDSNDDTAAV